MSEENEVMEEEVLDRGDDILAEVEEEVEEIVAEEEDDAGLESDEEIEEEVEEKEPMLPKSRYDSVAAKNRELEARIAQMEQQDQERYAQQRAQQQEQKNNEFEEYISQLDADYAEAVKDGDSEAMARIRREQREAEREAIRQEMAQTGQQSAAQAQEQVRLDLTIDAIEQQYDQLNPDSDTYSQDVVNEIQELRSGFEATGRYTPTQALVRAVKFVLPDNAVADAPDTAEAPTPKGDLKKKVAAANKQPPSLDGVGDQGNSGGVTSADPNPLDMSLEDMESLPESTLKRLRGDAF